MGTRVYISFILLLFSQSCFATSGQDTSTADMESSIARLDKTNYLPNLLPVILQHRDFIGLTDEQVNQLEQWRKLNREPMLAVMRQVAGKRMEIKHAALSPTVSAARLQQMQNEIFRLQREILQYKLSCRDHVVRTFNDENWTGLFIVLADEDIGVTLPVDDAK